MQSAKQPSKAYRGMAMEGPIAAWYAKNTQKDLKRHTLLAREIAGKIPSESSVLEIAPGPGYFCIELAKLGNYPITGLDISKSFVEIARQNATRAGIQAEFRQGNASSMPFPDQSFDLTVCQAAFKNFSQPVEAIAEMYRVLKPGGTSLIIDLRRDASLPEIDAEVDGMGLTWINALFTRWTFRLMLLKSAHSLEEIRSFVSSTPFRTGAFETSGIGFRLWLKKP